jgi:hypothetical protein
MLALFATAFIALTSNALAITAPKVSASQSQGRVYVSYALDSSVAMPSAVVLYQILTDSLKTGTFTAVDTVSPVNSPLGTFTRTGLTSGRSYTFYVIAYYSGGSQTSNQATISVGSQQQTGKPKVVAAIAQANTATVYYTLDSALALPSGVYLYEAAGPSNPSAGDFVLVDSVSSVNSYSGTFTRGSLTANSYYTYYVIALYSGAPQTSNKFTVFNRGTDSSTTITFTSNPAPTEATVGVQYSYDADAVASNGGTVRYKLNYAFNELQQTITSAAIDSVTGVLTLTPSATGKIMVQIAAYLAAAPQTQKAMTFGINVGVCAPGSRLHFEGQVVDGNGNPVPDASVTVTIARIDSATGITLAKSTVGVKTNGYYYLPINSGPGVYQIMAEGWNYIGQWYPNAYLQRDGSTISVSCGDTVIANFTLNMRPDTGWVTVKGNITAQSSGNKVMGMATFYGFENGIPDSVRWERRKISGPVYAMRDSSGTTGGYQVSLQKGYTWIGYGESYGNKGPADTLMPQYYNGVGNPAAASTIALTSNPTTINFALPTKASYNNSVSGTVVDYNASAVASRVVAFPLSNYGIADKMASSANADSANGSFSLTNLVPGDYVLWALPWSYTYAPGYMKSSAFASLSWRDATQITVNSTSTLTGNTIKVRRGNGSDGTASLRGVARGIPGSTIKKGNEIASAPVVAGALVLALDANDNVVAHGLTSTDGSFQIDGIGSNTHTLVIDKVGFLQYRQPVTTSDGETTNVGDVELSPTGTSSVPTAGISLIAEAAIYPNPVANAATVRFTATSGTTEFRIIDAAGNVVRTGQIHTVSGANTLAIETQGMATGLYMISLQSGSSSVVLPMTIVR